MQTTFYVKQGPAREVLLVGAQPTPDPGPGEVRVHLKTSGVNPSDSRSSRTAPMWASLIIPIATAPAILTGSARASSIGLASGSGFGTGCCGTSYRASSRAVRTCFNRRWVAAAT